MRMITLSKAQRIAAHVVGELRPFCKRIEIAGSIRRQRPEVGDIDLVIEPSDRPGIERRVTAKCKLEKCGEQYLLARMPDGTQLDVWFSHTPREVRQGEFFSGADVKPDNFGCLLLSRTGSTTHNIMLCERAKKLGRNFNPSWGVYQGGICVASATEAAIYHALGLEFIEPTAREFATRDEQLRAIHRLQTA